MVVLEIVFEVRTQREELEFTLPPLEWVNEEEIWDADSDGQAGGVHRMG